MVESSGLLNLSQRFSKCKKIQQILLPANYLHRFQPHLSSSDFTQFDEALVTKIVTVRSTECS